METRHRRYFPLSAALLGPRAKKLSRGPLFSQRGGAIFKANRRGERRDWWSRRARLFFLRLSSFSLQGQYNRSINRRFPIILPLHASNLRLFLRKTALESNFFSPFFCILYAVTKNGRIVSVSANSRVFKFNFKIHLDTLVRAVIIS